MQDLFAFLGVDASFVPQIHPDLNAGQLPRYRWSGRLARRAARSGGWLKQLLPQPWRDSLFERMTQQLPPPPLPPELRQRLIDTYRADLIALEALLRQNSFDLDFADWLRS